MNKANQHIVNTTDIQSLVSCDPIFFTIQAQYGIPPNWSRPQWFITLSKIILEQQVSLQSANAHFLKLNNYLPSFSPESIMKLSDEEMKSCQISRQKATYLRSVSVAVMEQKIDFAKLGKLNSLEVRQQLMALKGIGNWTTDIYQMFCLQAKDIFPIGDVAVVTTMRELTTATTKEAIISRAEEWQPFRSLATYFLWHYYLKKRNRAALM